MTPPASLIEAVSQRLDSFVSARRAETASLGAEAALLVDHAERSLAGGKRLRARFCAAGWHAVADLTPGPERLDAASPAVGVCAALEVFQAAALVHDDIIDNADTRRGRPSAHRALEADHAERAWDGDATAFGRSGAVLLGDLLVAWSDDLLEEAVEYVPSAGRARAEYALMRREVTLGQFLDIAEESAWAVAPQDELADRALRIASYKSARYSVQRPLTIGASLAGADDAQLDALRRFGLPIGLAFQLRDDVLGVFGDASETGKPTGDDLREGKRTLLVALTRARLDGPRLADFDARFGAPDLRDGEVARLATAIRETGALDEVERRISSLSREADAALADARLEADATASLRDLAEAATQRRG